MGERVELLLEAASQRALAGEDPAVMRLAREAWDLAIRIGATEPAALAAIQLNRFIDDDEAAARLRHVLRLDLRDDVRVLALTQYAWRLRWTVTKEDVLELAEEAVDPGVVGAAIRCPRWWPSAPGSS